MHSLLEHWNLMAETYEDYQSRYNGFGKDFFEKIKSTHPNVFKYLKFFKPTPVQADNAIALYQNSVIVFAIQLDPSGEVIVLWNDSECIEIGTWSKNASEEALTWITSQFSK